MVSSQEPAPAGVDSLISSHLDLLRRLPDCRYQYLDKATNVTNDVESSSAKLFEFCKLGDCFYIKAHWGTDAKSGICSMVAYDGKTFYDLDHSGNLQIASSSRDMAHVFSSYLLRSPLYAPFHLLASADLTEFRLPEILTAQSWAKNLTGVEVTAAASKDGISEVTWSKPDVDISWQISLKDQVPVKAVGTWKGLDTEWAVARSERIPWISERFAMPLEVKQVWKDKASKKPVSFYSAEVIAGSLEKVANLPIQTFQIPRSTAKVIYDLDFDTELTKQELIRK